MEGERVITPVLGQRLMTTARSADVAQTPFQATGMGIGMRHERLKLPAEVLDLSVSLCQQFHRPVSSGLDVVMQILQLLL